MPRHYSTITVAIRAPEGAVDTTVLQNVIQRFLREWTNLADDEACVTTVRTEARVERDGISRVQVEP